MTSGHDKMTELARRDTTADDAAVAAAHSTVALARARLLEVRRAFIRREAGAATVAAAEARLSVALDQLDRAAP